MVASMIKRSGSSVAVAIGPDEFSYEETTTMLASDLDTPYVHTDRNVLRRSPTIDLRGD